MTNKKLMIVDDEELICWTLSEAFRREGYDVVSCNSGEQALEGMRKDAADAMILDLRLPGISGLDVLAEVKQIHPETRVILITACETDEVRERAKDLGNSGVFPKPLDLVGLKEAVARALQS